MSWKEPDPKRRPSSEGPPELDELFDKFTRFFRRMSESGKRGGNGNNSNTSFAIKGIVLGIIGAALLAWIVAGFHIIDQQERGVLFRLGKYQDTLQPGLQWQPPLVDVIETVNTTRIREMSTQGRMLTEDENIIQATVLVQYRVIDPKKYLIDLRRPELSLSNALDASLRHVVGSSEMNLVLTDGRAEVAVLIGQRLQRSLDDYKSGIEIVKINIEKTQAPSEVQDAFDDVIKAREDKQRFRNQAEAYANQIIPQARGTAKRVVAEAQGHKEQIVNLAKGQATRFEKLLVEYEKAPEITRKRLYLETQEFLMQRVTKIIIDDASNNITFLPLDQLLSRTQTSRKAFDDTLSEEERSTNAIDRKSVV